MTLQSRPTATTYDDNLDLLTYDTSDISLKILNFNPFWQYSLFEVYQNGWICKTTVGFPYEGKQMKVWWQELCQHRRNPNSSHIGAIYFHGWNTIGMKGSCSASHAESYHYMQIIPAYCMLDLPIFGLNRWKHTALLHSHHQ